MENSLNLLDVDKIILSYSRKSIIPRFILNNKLYPINIILPKFKCLFGVDKIYDKSYIKLYIDNNLYLEKFMEIENRLKMLVLEKENVELDSNICNNSISFLLDKNLEISDNKSIFGLKAGMYIECSIILGNIYIVKNKGNYKWIINKLTFV